MKSATFPGTAQVLYGYDKDNRLVIEKDAYTPTNIRVYLWDDLGQIILVKRANQYYSYAYDAFKRIQFEEELEMLETCGTAVTIYDYNAYGKILSENGTSHTPFRYACYYYDTDTDLYYLQNRYYAADKARFMTEDPYWNVSNMLYGKFTSTVERRVYYPAVVQSENRYVYCGNKPTNRIAPFGLESYAFYTIGKNRIFQVKHSGIRIGLKMSANGRK